MKATPLRKMTSRSTLHVEMRLSREFRCRAWVAIKMMRLACRILGCGIKITDTTYTDEDTNE